MPVSPTTGNGNSYGAGPLRDTTSRYLVGSTARISTRHGYRPLSSNSARKDRAHRNVRANGACLDTQGDICEERIVTRGTCRYGPPGHKSQRPTVFPAPQKPGQPYNDHHNQKSTHLFPAVRELRRKQTRDKSRKSRKGRRGLTGS